MIGRQAAVKVTDQKPLILVDKLQLLVFQNAAELVAQNRQQHLAVERLLGRRPIDVEKPGIWRAGTVFQHVLPPTVVRIVDPHVVRNQIDQQAQAAAAVLFGHALKILRRPQLRIDPAMIDDVVAVGAAAARAKKRRQIKGPDSQLLEIAGQRLSVGKLQMTQHLQPIG